MICQVKEAGGDLDTKVHHPGARIAKDVGADALALDAANRVFDVDALGGDHRIDGFFVSRQLAAPWFFARDCQRQVRWAVPLVGQVRHPPAVRRKGRGIGLRQRLIMRAATGCLAEVEHATACPITEHGIFTV